METARHVRSLFSFSQWAQSSAGFSLRLLIFEDFKDPQAEEPVW
jgi:hypothetical protein